MNSKAFPRGSIFRIVCAGILFIPLVFFFLTTPFSQAADDQTTKAVRRNPSQTGLEGVGKKVALVIGNKNYKDMPLRNPVNDAEDLSLALKRLGFTVITKTNVNKKDFEEAIDQFAREIRDAQIAFFYFSGHGCEAKGENYLVPVDDTFKDAADLHFKAVKAGFVLEKMEDAAEENKDSNRLNIIILDACRNNPFKGVRSPSRGLTEMRAPAGSFIAYATAPGTVAADGDERNGVYTKHLLRAIESNGVSEQAFKVAARKVYEETKGQQRPWISFDIVPDFFSNSSPMRLQEASLPPSSSPVSAPVSSSEYREKAERLGVLLGARGDTATRDELYRMYKDPEAVKWFRQAAEQGDALAELWIGRMFAQGLETPKDEREGVKWYRKAADQGNSSAQNNLGSMYKAGKGVVKDQEEAVKWFRKAADQGNAAGQCNLGVMYESGSGVARDQNEAVKWYKKAVEQGNAMAQGNLGRMYQNGWGVPKDYAEAVKWYRKAADQGNATTQANLAGMYRNGFGVAKDNDEAVKWYKKAVEQGNADGQNGLGIMYQYGFGVAKDYEEALKWYRKAADQRNAWAQCNLGVMYANGYGVPKDYEEAVKWYKKAVEQGHAVAQNNLGQMYQNGWGVPKDYAEALKWYKKAVEQGNANGQCNLGVMYANGYGVAKDYEEAVKWYKRAVEQGHALAQNNLGAKYRDGLGVPKDYNEAMKWFKKAAEQGDTNALANLGFMYENGYGVPKDRTEAIKWFTKAADKDNEYAKKELLKLTSTSSQRPASTIPERPTSNYRSEAERLIRLVSTGNSASAREDLKHMYQDPEAVKWFRHAGEQGDIVAQAMLGNMFENGIGVPKDYPEALKWTRKAAEQGSAYAQCGMALSYQFGRGVEKDYSAAATWYRKAAEQGHIWAQSNLALMYQNGSGVTKDNQEALKWYRKAAEQGNPEAQTSLGYMYDSGTGVAKDSQEAVKWYRKAADQGHARGEGNLGTMYLNGQGVRKDYQEAVKWLKKGADQGNAAAQHNLGIAYQNGYGVTKDRNEAAKWFKKAADQGNENAKKELLKLTSTSSQSGSPSKGASGEGQTEFSADDITSLSKAAQFGNAKAQFELGFAYRTGKNVPKDPQKAVSWYRKAAEQDYPGAFYQLGNMLENGFGVKQDYEEAHKWYSKGASLGNEGCKRGVKDVEKYIEWKRQGKSPKQYQDREIGIVYTVYPDNSISYHSGDRDKIQRLQRKLADQGNVAAQLFVGLDYFHGRNGTAKNLDEAKKWLSKAAKKGNAVAKEFLEKIPSK